MLYIAFLSIYPLHTRSLIAIYNFPKYPVIFMDLYLLLFKIYQVKKVTLVENVPIDSFGFLPIQDLEVAVYHLGYQVFLSQYAM